MYNKVRLPITEALVDSGIYTTNDYAKLVFSSPLITGNKYNVTINGVAIAEVTFSTDFATTLGLIVTAINNLAITAVASITAGGTQVQVSYPGERLYITGSLVTAGATQADAVWVGKADQPICIPMLLTKAI
jgi:hypothetical protein